MKSRNLHGECNIAPDSNVCPDQRSNVLERIITIVVGKGSNARTFQIYRGLLCHHSGLFRTLLQGPLKDKDWHTLPNEKPETFQLFYDWLYSGEVICDDTMDLTYKSVVDLYFFADAFVVQQLRDRALALYLFGFLKGWDATKDLTPSLYRKEDGGHVIIAKVTRGHHHGHIVVPRSPVLQG
jgi:hypothetical protein